MVVVFTIVAVVMFFMLIRMRIDMLVQVMLAMGAMVDDHRLGPDVIDRKNCHAENHEKTEAPHQGMTKMVLSAILPGVRLVVAMSRMDHEERDRGELVKAVKRMLLGLQEGRTMVCFLKEGKENIDGDRPRSWSLFKVSQTALLDRIGLRLKRVRRCHCPSPLADF